MSQHLEEMARKIQNNVMEIMEVLQQKDELSEQVDKLEGVFKSHAPEGRNYTNHQYITLLLKNSRYLKGLKQLQKDLYDHDKYRGRISKGTIHELDLQIDDILEGES
ncbi:hypothetical protein [Oceanobacillus profundus]|uniref:Uncharacterized protein n=1 Tax=Oceanobacillus profundus TaxID=372463 RepID=A0A417YGI0_9BACI|nr:hypothetical protein [Oceanobacillus profundus]MBR2246108.1 hypothetical protein [Bacilli bacterium]MBR3119779.1 hypothetical protein [Oceanobacillus sp.]RHW31927.1 hypothetical protein D1B32_11860 [Oceanobacillus profundus]